MMSIFHNKYGQMRWGWQILLAIIFSFIVGIVIYMILGLALLILNLSLDERELLLNDLFNALLGQAAVLIGTFWAFRTVTKKPIRELGLQFRKDSIYQLVFGLIFGAVSISLVFVILNLTGHISIAISGLNFSTDLLTGLIIFLLVGFSEEIFFRGYVMSALDQMKKPWAVILLSSFIFSIAHLGNPNLTVLGIINIGFVGVLFAFMYVKTKSLWMPIGYHITWNYFQGNIWGLPVSGLDINGLFSSEIIKEDILSGGAFGPEGGLICTMVIALGFFVLNSWTKKKI